MQKLNNLILRKGKNAQTEEPEKVFEKIQKSDFDRLKKLKEKSLLQRKIAKLEI